ARSMNSWARSRATTLFPTPPFSPPTTCTVLMAECFPLACLQSQARRRKKSHDDVGRVGRVVVVVRGAARRGARLVRRRCLRARGGRAPGRAPPAAGARRGGSRARGGEARPPPPAPPPPGPPPRLCSRRSPGPDTRSRLGRLEQPLHEHEVEPAVELARHLPE